MASAVRGFVLFLLIHSWTAFAPPATGPDLVRAELAPFYDALVTRLGESEAHAYLEHWTPKEVTFFRGKIRKLLENSIEKKGKVPSPEVLYAKYGGEVFGTLGEAYGNALVRRATSGQGGIVFLDESRYNALNPEGKKPDGVIFTVEGNTLILKGLLESKLGTGGYDRAQAEGYLKKWQRDGITVDIDGKPTLFSPDRIKVTSPGGILPLSGTGKRDFENITTLIATRDWASFGGKVNRVPFDASTAREVAYSLVGNLVAGREVEQVRDNFRVPVLEGEAQEEFRRQLRDWLLEKRAWPKSHGTTGAENYLARQISFRGGQASVFIHDIDGAVRHLLPLSGMMPAMSPLQNKLLATNPSDPNAVSALRAYIRRYENSRESQATPDHIPIIERLKEKSPEWRAFFENHPPVHFRSAAVGEINQCLEALINLDH